MDYKVKTEVFEGPFDLLLHLVRINEMDIYDIPIAEITRQYLKYISDMQELDLHLAGEFLVMAATLINIKSRTLMPPQQEQAEEEEEEIDQEDEDIKSAQDLMRRLIEYRQFKEMAVKLQNREEKQLRLFYRNSVLPQVTNKNNPKELREDISLLFSAFARILKFADGRPTHHVQKEEFSVDEKIDFLRREIIGQRRVNVGQVFKACHSKDELITTFLAVLELCRMRLARVKQENNYQDIYLIYADDWTEEDEDDD